MLLELCFPTLSDELHKITTFHYKSISQLLLEYVVQLLNTIDVEIFVQFNIFMNTIEERKPK